MGFFSDIGKKTSETASKIQKEAKLKLQINQNKGKIADLYEIVGKKVYELHVRGETENLADYVSDECSSLDSLAKEIEDARLEILKLNQKRLCINCSAEIEKGTQFCPKCGQKQDEEEPTVEEKALEKLENTEIEPEKKKEAEIVKEELEEKIETANQTEEDSNDKKEDNK